ncbi:uncharacterized protein TrAtP1_010493 [Trichoderma atroviride]|uniref:uncharacterized protein n=1 Tax=Hypocrea atroviridis TaxID=63577 RepID=UPI00331AD172|nr:hypothetical protein TrAtP1_010493 [Trichoderma atroviride]
MKRFSELELVLAYRKSDVIRWSLYERPQLKRPDHRWPLIHQCWPPDGIVARIMWPVVKRFKKWMPQASTIAGMIQNPTKNGVGRLKAKLQQQHGVVVKTKVELVP